MADESLEWELKVQDLMSGPLGRIEAQISSLDRAMGKLKPRAAGVDAMNAKIAKSLGQGKTQLLAARSNFGKAWDALSGGGATQGVARRLGFAFGVTGKGFANLTAAAKSYGSALTTRVMPALKGLGGHLRSALPSMVTAGTVMAAGAAALGVAAGKWALGGLAFKEDSLVAFKTMLGTQEAAQRTFDWATKFAATTPFSSEQVISNAQRLLTGGFKEGELDTLMKAVGDVGANMGDQKMEQVITAIVQTKAKGKLQGEEMMQLAEGGVGQTAVFEALARNLGISKTEAQARVSSGRVTGEQGVAAVVEAIRQTQSGGELGGAMGAKSKTLTGLFSSLKDIPSTMLFGADTGGLVEPLKKMMGDIIGAFEKGKPLFKKGTAMIERVSAAWSDAFGTIGGSGIEGFLGNVIDSVGSFIESAAPFAEGFFPELMNQVEAVLTALGGSADAEEIRSTGESVARGLGAVAWGFTIVAKTLDALVSVIMGILSLAGINKNSIEQVSSLAGRFFGGGASDEEAKRSAEEFERYRALKGKPAYVSDFEYDLAKRQNAQPNVTTTVGSVIVQVQPGDEKAGVNVANQVRGALPSTLSNWATEHGG